MDYFIRGLIKFEVYYVSSASSFVVSTHLLTQNRNGQRRLNLRLLYRQEIFDSLAPE
jgi:hypothetical protein